MKFVQDAKDWWKWFSMRAMALAVALQATWAALPPEMQESLPDGVVTAITVVILLAGMFGRVVDQP